MWQKTIMAIAIASIACGCAGAVHQLPQLDQSNLSLAQTEVRSASGAPSRHSVSDEEVAKTLAESLARIRPAATELCHEMAVGVCEWRFMKSNDHSLNAGAAGNGIIFVNRGVLEYATNDEEVSMVIAHEIGHQAANHVATGERNQMVGALVGALLGGVAGALASKNSPYSPTITRSSADVGSSIGGAVGRLSFSKEQEREADYLSALILYRSGLDLDKARGILVIMARASGRKETGMLDSHPAGPERLAAWDKAVVEIRASNGALPKRAH